MQYEFDGAHTEVLAGFAEALADDTLRIVPARDKRTGKIVPALVTMFEDEEEPDLLGMYFLGTLFRADDFPYEYYDVEPQTEEHDMTFGEVEPSWWQKIKHKLGF